MALKILKYAGFVFFGILIFVFFTYLNFPYNKLTGKVFSQLEQQTGVILDIGDLRPTMTFGVKMTDVSVSKKGSKFDPLKIPALSASPSLFSLITFQPKVSFSADLVSGAIEGSFQQKGKAGQAISVALSEVNIKQNFKDIIPLDLSGIVEGSLNLVGNFAKGDSVDGKAKFKIEKLALAEMMIMNMKIPAIQLSTLNLNGELKKQNFEIKQFDIGGPKDDLQAILSGKILFNFQAMDRSRLDMKVKLKLSDKLKEEFKMFLPFIQAAQKPDGFYHLDVSGRLTAPVALPAKG